MHRSICLLSILVLSAAASHAGSTEALIASPRSLRDLTARCAVVAEVEIVQTNRVQRHTRVSDEEFIEVSARVTSSLKGEVSPGSVLTFLERPIAFEHVADASPSSGGTFATGGRYVMFLNWNAALGSFVAYGPEGRYRIINGTIRAAGLSSVARAQEGRPSSSFAQDIRKYAAERPER
jgi:hypothetical protein